MVEQTLDLKVDGWKWGSVIMRRLYLGEGVVLSQEHRFWSLSSIKYHI